MNLNNISLLPDLLAVTSTTTLEPWPANVYLPPALNRVNRTVLADTLRSMGINVTWNDEPPPTPKIDWIVRNCSLAPNKTWREGGNWLFKTPTLICGCGEWDNSPQSTFSKVFLLLLYVTLGSLSVVLCHPRFGGGDVGMGAARPSSGETSGSDEDETSSESSDEIDVGSLRNAPKPKTRLWFLDFARVSCIWCVVAEHSGGENYTANNVFLVQQWVLPYLYTVSGISFMLSSAPLTSLLLKLTILFFIGVGFNLFADHLIGRDWQSDFGNTIFQMAYVVVLMALAICLEPIRKALRWRQRRSFKAKPPKCLKLGLIFFYVPLAAAGFGWYLLGSEGMEDLDLGSMQGTGLQVLSYLPLLMAQCGGLGVICSLSIAVGSSRWTFWILLVIVMAQQIWIPYRRGGHPFDGDLYLLGMMAYSWPMKGKELIQKVIHGYWPLLFAMALTWAMPHVEGRCDLDPMNTWWERMRFYSLEASLLILLFSDAISPRDPYEIMNYLNMWALFAYCSHVAWARLFPVPFGGVFTYLSIVPFVIFGMRAHFKQKQVHKDNGELLSDEYRADFHSQDEGPHRP